MDAFHFAVCRPLYLVASVLTNAADSKPITDVENFVRKPVPLKKFSKLGYIRKLDPEAYAYLIFAIDRLKQKLSD